MWQQEVSSCDVLQKQEMIYLLAYLGALMFVMYSIWGRTSLLYRPKSMHNRVLPIAELIMVTIVSTQSVFKRPFSDHKRIGIAKLIASSIGVKW